jgi:VIT1/CCC1 family predicted Fe2+/Mn2+ transporter
LTRAMPPDAPPLRASDADREAAAERLRQACLEGRLDSDELEERLEAAYGSRWVADLERLTADVTPPPVAAPAVAPPIAPAPAGPTTNGLAVASLTASIVWLGWLGSIAAIIFGHVALGQIKRSGGRETGTGLALAGLVLGYCGIGLLLIVIIAAAGHS